MRVCISAGHGDHPRHTRRIYSATHPRGKDTAGGIGGTCLSGAACRMFLICGTIEQQPIRTRAKRPNPGGPLTTATWDDRRRRRFPDQLTDISSAVGGRPSSRSVAITQNSREHRQWKMLSNLLQSFALHLGRLAQRLEHPVYTRKVHSSSL
jgi:hypothetical protein